MFRIALDIKHLHRMVWQFRHKTADNFPVPNRLDSLRFAFTEIAEAVDAFLRQNGEYKRNREKGHDITAELAQCLMMLCTAYGDRPMPSCDFYARVPTLDTAAVVVAKLLDHPEDDGRLRFAMWNVSYLLGDQAESALAQVLDRLEQKHASLFSQLAK